MRLITTIALALLGLTTWAQTSLPDLPTGAQRYSQTLWLVPSDSTLWTGATGNYAQVATREQLRQLASQGYTKSQVDSAITSQIGLIDFPVTSVAGKTGDVGLDASDVGLGNVDNTTDLDKPISTATQGALDGKENAFSKGSLVAGTGVTLDGTLANRLVGSGNVTINSTSSLTASNGLQIISEVISPQYGTLAGTVAQGNDARINNGQIAYNRGNFRDYGLGTNNGVDFPNSDLNNISYNTGIYHINGVMPGNPFNFGTIIAAKVAGTDAATQLAISIQTSGGLQYRGKTGSGSFYAWRQVWDSENFTPPDVFTRSISGLVPSPGGSGSTRFLREDGSWVAPTGGGGGGTATDLSIANRNANTLQIGSSTGNNATVPAATTSLSGLMTAADKSKVNDAITVETDPTVPNHVKSITSGNIANWNAAYNRGNFRDYGLGTNNGVDFPNSDLNNISYNTGIYHINGVMPGNPFNFGTIIAAKVAGTDAATQLAISIQTSGGLQYRGKTGSGSFYAWRQVWDSENFTPADYLQTSNFTWSNLSGKPSTFTPSPHSHSAADINSGTLAAARIGNATVSNAKLANMGANTIKGRGGSTGAPQDLTAAQVRAILNVADGAQANVATNLAVGTRTTTTVPVTSSTGTNANLPAATTSLAGVMSSADKTKLDGIATGATANATDAQLRARSSHTGTQAISTVSGLQSALDARPLSGTATNQVRTNTQLDARYVQSIGAGSGISVSGTTVSLSNMGANTIKGRGGSTGAPQDLTPTQVRDIINPVTTNSTTTINMQNPLQRGSARSSNSTFSLSNSSAGRQVQFHMANSGSNAIQITITGATPHGNRIIPSNQSAVISIIDFGNNVISYIVVPSI